MKSLIAYYSRPGNNYVNGNIVNLSVGNTEVAAKMIQNRTGWDLFRIDTVKGYPVDHTETTDVAKKELRQNARPELPGRVDNLAGYDVVYLGYPNGWGTMPMAVFTFLEGRDFSGKSTVSFCTHEESGVGRSESDTRSFAPLPGC
jgi:flavodoxin